MEKICGIYKITNTITGDFYIGSSKNVKSRLESHKWPSTWKQHPNNPMYIDMQKYGVDKFVFQILEEVEADKLKETEQKFIELLNPSYNNYNAKGLDIERYKEYQKEYKKEYEKTDKRKEYKKQYNKSDKCKAYQNKYYSQLCFFNGETITLNALSLRFRRRGLSNPTQEAKKYLL